MNTNDVWRIWDREKKYGHVLYRRAIGELPEMESSKSLASQMAGIVKPEDRILDVGCGAGHYLRSLLSVLDIPFTYTGIDATKGYIELARKAWEYEKRASFMVGDIFSLPFDSAEYDVVICCNMLLHLPAIKKPINELVRVAGKNVLVRSLFGNRSFRVQEVYSHETHPDFPPFYEGNDEFHDNGEPRSFYYLNTYSTTYVSTLLKKNPRVLSYTLFDDTNFDPQAINRDAEGNDGQVNATRSLSGRQFNGPLHMQWQYLHIRLN